jgi:hypothetical protein
LGLAAAARVGFFASGALKLVLAREKVAPKFGSTNDFSAEQIKFIGLA